MPESRPVADFDPHSQAHAANTVQGYAELRRECPVVWSPRHGGFWVVSSYDELTAVARNPECFTTRKGIDPEGRVLGGTILPAVPGLPALLPLESDPPEWNDFRRLVAGPFTRRASEARRCQVRQITSGFIDNVISVGSCDLVKDIARPIPSRVILDILGLPLESEYLYACFHDLNVSPVGSPRYEQARADRQRVAGEVADTLQSRRESPEEDLLSVIANAEIKGSSLSSEEALSFAFNLIAGGLDTTTSFLSSALVYLDEHVELREPLRTDSSALGLAIEELLRYSAPVQQLARTATADVVIGGQQICAGDRVMLAFASANRDDQAFERSNEIVIDRHPNPHTSWGVGIHKCMGQHLARVTSEVVLQEVLERMPDYSISSSEAKAYERLGTVNGWSALPASFTPGSPLAATV